MRKSLVRRIVAALVLALGIGVAAGATPAVAAPAHHAVSQVQPADWFWG